MKFELRSFQEEAVAKALKGLRRATSEYESARDFTAVSLSAPTGAGKTVIATAVIERVLFGDTEDDVAADGNAIFLWLTDDPSLNEQTRKKMIEASDKIQPGHLVTLDDQFDQPEFDRGKVYFLNIQKLGRRANLATRKEGRRERSIWETIAQTIRANGSRFYLIIDEAHRGTGSKGRDEQTIVQRMINGSDVSPATPIVFGISATPQRFEKAIKSGAQERTFRQVTVPEAEVRESGLIKDVLSISYRGEADAMEVTLMRQAVAALKEADAAWSAYSESEGEPPVRPALVMQLPAKSKPNDVEQFLDVCIDQWDELGKAGAIGHSFETHAPIEFGKHVVRYIKPQDIQDHPSLRLILFKEALTTGWDCPRAEVMISLRTAKDDTYIAQLIGRMVRSPLARRIASDETLNRVRLYLPNFDVKTVDAIKTKLESDDGGVPSDVEVDAVDARRNADVPEEAFRLIEALPSYQVPGPVHRSQVARLHKLAALLVGDELLESAIANADKFLVSVIDIERDRLDSEGVLAPRLKDLGESTVGVLEFRVGGSDGVYSEETHATDATDLNRLYARAKRLLRDGLAEAYWAHAAHLGEGAAAEGVTAFDAKLLTIALAIDQSVIDRVEAQAADRVRQWLDSYGDAIAALSADRQLSYSDVRAMAREPEVMTPTLPSGPITMPSDESVAAYQCHLYADRKADYRARLGVWEQHALAVEQARDGFVAWYRNPTGGQRCVRVPYFLEQGYGKLYPDFVVVHRDDDGDLRASIVDPHGHHLADASSKLRGLASYAHEHGDAFARIIGVIQDKNGKFRMLDLKDATVRHELKDVSSQEAIEALFAKLGAAYE